MPRASAFRPAATGTDASRRGPGRSGPRRLDLLEAEQRLRTPLTRFQMGNADETVTRISDGVDP
ncbi:MAG: hypothetical protein ACE5LU_09350 [Anaerolineae bacterium]